MRPLLIIPLSRPPLAPGPGGGEEREAGHGLCALAQGHRQDGPGAGEGRPVPPCNSATQLDLVIVLYSPTF